MEFLKLEHQNQLEQIGYVTAQLLNLEQVHELQQEFEQIRSEHPFPFTLCSPSYNLKKKVYQLLKEKLQPSLVLLLKDYRITGANFYFKAKGSSNNTVPPHQDWTFTDEHKCSSLNVWLPLVDVDKTNGAYHIIEGSHRWHFTYRGSNIPSAASGLPCNFDVMKYLPLQKGEAIIYDHRLVHSTPANISSSDRISLVLNLVPITASLIHAIIPEPGSSHLKVYEVDEEFYCRYTFVFGTNRMPDGYKLLREEKYEAQQFTTQ